MPRRSIKRKHDLRNIETLLLIFTEGEATEVNYFKSIKNELRLITVEIVITGLADHTNSLVDRVIAQKNVSSDENSEWWVVIDRDDHENFNQSIQKAKKHDIHVAYSNECFELWFYLHFHYLNTSIGRKNFPIKLSKLIGEKYKKSTDVYSAIKKNEKSAIKNAKKLEKMHDTEKNTSYESRDPSTTVFKLVERLRNFKN